MQSIGIVACSAEGAALCYRTICTEAPLTLGKHAHPEIALHSQSLADYVACIDRDDWSGVADIMLASAHKLASAGADFLICPDNTIHQALPLLASRSPLPWLHIAEIVADEAVRRNLTRIGLTGTRSLVESDVYPKALSARGLAFVRPDATDREVMDRGIMDELVDGIFKPETTARFLAVIDRLREAGCDAVVLGCTEIPLIVSNANASLPVLDSTRLLARAALRRATS